MGAPTEVLSGARSVLKLNEVIVGYCVGVTLTTGINYQPISVIGSLAVVEHVPVAYTVEMSANMARIAKVSRLNSAQGFPTRAGQPTSAANAQSPQIMPAYGTDGLPILKSGELEATIFDTVLGKTLYKVTGVKCQNKSFDIAPGGAVTENCTFVARIVNETGAGGDAEESTSELAAS